MNKNLFANVKTLPVATATNAAGGRAYDRTSESALAQVVVTGTLNGTFYASADENLTQTLELASKCESTFLANLAVYASLEAKMKDTPALLLGVLFSRKDNALFESTFYRIIKNTKGLRNFVQVVRSGVTGRKSFGTFGKKVMQNWLARQKADSLFRGSIGNDPSLADVVKMVHPKAENGEKQAFYAWLLGRDYNASNLSPLLRKYEDFKKNGTGEVPDVDFRMLSSLTLSKSQWTDLALNASWNTLRMNLNNFKSHGVFDDNSVVKILARKLSDADTVRRENVFPYQLLTSYQNTTDVPALLRNALQDAMEVACENVPVFENGVAVCVDTSGSMGNAVTGNRPGATSKTTCIDVAALIAVSVLRKNPEATIIPFDTSVHISNLNPKDSVMTNATKLSSYGGGGTDCASALTYLNSKKVDDKLVIYASDNESWFDANTASYPSWMTRSNSKATNMASEWKTYTSRVKGAKLVCIDLTPNKTVQVVDANNVLNIGGFSDTVFTVIDNFANGSKKNFVEIINDFAKN